MDINLLHIKVVGHGTRQTLMVVKQAAIEIERIREAVRKIK